MTRARIKELRSGDRGSPLLVVWEDITGAGGSWHDKAKLPTPTKCETVGWPLQWEPHLVIAGSRIPADRSHGDTTAIPWGVVLEARWLRG